jgi:branched-chain amino acid aminotransferase
MKRVCYNGDFVESEKISLDKVRRGFNFGDGIFETIRVGDGKPLFLKAHFKRFFKGLDELKIVHSNINPEILTSRIQELIDINNITNGARIRLSAFRSGSGSYFPISNDLNYLIEIFHIDANYYNTNKRGLSVELFNDLTKPYNRLSSFKTSNALIYVMASVFATENNFDDVFLLNDNGNVIESTNSNVFISSNGVLYTPPLSEGCIGGIMRMKLINLAISKGIVVYENKMPPQHLMAADEIIITNTIQGFRWIGKYKEKRYFNSLAKKLNDALNEDVFNYQKDLMEN